jgi:GDPmannose 4,6-dehydratase
MIRKVIVTGVLGQDGANMAEKLIRIPGYEVYGMMRRSANPNFINTKKFKDSERFKFIYGDLTDDVSLDNLVRDIQPDYFINFAANSFVGCSWDMPEQVMDVNCTGVLRCLEAIRKFKPECRFYSAGSSEEFGDVDYSPQDMKHPIKPRSPYGASKAAARHLVKVYRESHGLYAVHGILFNHEGTKRGEEFVTRKISKGVAAIKKHLETNMTIEAPPAIELGNLDAKRDWSDSEDFINGVWLMLNQPEPKDYILASGETHSIREFVEKAFKYAEINGYWAYQGVDETYLHRDSSYGHSLVKVNPKFYRPAEVEVLMGDPTDAIENLGWRPKGSFDTLVQKMVRHDIENQV